MQGETSPVLFKDPTTEIISLLSNPFCKIDLLRIMIEYNVLHQRFYSLGAKFQTTSSAFFLF